jgi:Recombinase zinc beta ribbon domain
VTREQFDRVQAKIATNRSFAKRNNTTTQYLLRALVSCGACRLACIARRTLPTGRTYYICSGKSIRARQDQGCRCRSKFIPAGVLDELVWNDLAALVRDPDRVARALRRVAGGCGLPQELQARRETLRRGRASLAQQIERLTDAYVSGVLKLAEYDRRRKDLERRDATLAQQEAMLDHEASRSGAVQGLIDSAESFSKRVRAGLDTATFERKRQLVELLINRVVVTGDNVEIRYAFPISPAGESGRFCHLRLDYLRAPHLIRTRDRHVPQQVGIDLVLTITDRRFGPAIQGFQTHDTHQSLHPFTVHRSLRRAQHQRQLPRTVERVVRVQPIQPRHQLQVFGVGLGRLVIETRPSQPQQLALPTHAQLRVVRLDLLPLPLKTVREIFFSRRRARLGAARSVRRVRLIWGRRAAVWICPPW